MASAAALVELGDRYWALGLPAAARSALVRALDLTGDVAPALRLADLALAQGDTDGARAYAAEAARRAPGPATRVLLGRAQLAAGELAGARMSLLTALDAPKLAPWDRARAHLGLSRAAEAQGDAAGAAAQAATAHDAALAAVTAGEPVELGLVEEIAATVVAHGRAADAAAAIEAARSARPACADGTPVDRTAPPSGGAAGRAQVPTVELAAPPSGGAAGRAQVPTVELGALAAVLAGARHAAGDAGVTEAMIDDELARAEQAAGAARAALRLRRLERRARKGGAEEHARLASELDALAHDAAGEALTASERARLQFLCASVYEDDPATRERAEQAYRKGLTFQPGHTAAACRLALLVLDRGDQAGALAEIERALRIDASYGAAWRNAVRMLDAASPSLGVVVGRLLDAANPGAGSAAAAVAPRLVTATAEVARHDVLAGVYAHGHRVKNLLGIIGARTRSARKLAAETRSAEPDARGDVHDRLKELERDVTALYEEWAQYLRSLQAPAPQVELVPLSSLLHEVVVAAQARTQQVPIALEQAAALPDVRGDRMLLREALLNVVSNAAEACAAAVGEVVVRVRAIASPASSAAPLVEVVVADTGPGIPRAHLGRLFVPGFTTKETGSGVGLAIAERVVAAHHGRITVDSEEGRGTTITITLPSDHAGLAALPRWTGEPAGRT